MLKINPQTGEAEEISLFDLLDGGVKELAALNLSRVLENIRDVNTEAKKVRSLSVKFNFLPNEDRDEVNVTIALKKQDLSKVLTVYLLHLSAANSRAGVWQERFVREFPGIDFVVCAK